MTPVQAYLMGINTLILFGVAVIVLYLVKSYNILVRDDTYITSPKIPKIVPETVEIKIPRSAINENRRKILASGYAVTRSSYENGLFTLTMKKNGDKVR